MSTKLDVSLDLTNGGRIINMPAPQSPQDAAPRSYVDTGPDKPIVVKNLMQDPRATATANFVALTGGGATTTQAPTNRVDGSAQAAATKSCVEVIQTAPAISGTTNYMGMGTNVKGAAKTIGVQPGQMVACRFAYKVTGAVGTWYTALLVNYFNSAGTFLSAAVPALSPNSPGTGVWLTLEGFDNTAPATAAYCEVYLQVFGVTAATSTTMRMTEIVVTVDGEGDIPGYAGGDLQYGRWLGTADASQSITQFDPAANYPTSAAQPFGLTNWELTYKQLPQYPFTVQEFIQISRDVGATAARMSLAFWQDNNPSAPSLTSAALTYLEACVSGGLDILLNVGGFPAYLAPTHMPTLSAAINNTTTTSISVSAVAPANIAMPFDIMIDNERLTVTAGATTTTWTVTRGVGGTTAATHTNGTRLVDYLFNQAFGHLYYPDSGSRTLYGTAIVNLINQVSADTGIPASAWCLGVEVWNEPNLNADDTRNEGAAGYSAFLSSVYTNVRAAFPTMNIMGGALSTLQSTTVAGPTGTVDVVAYLNSMFTAGAQYTHLDIHPYPNPDGTSGNSITNLTTFAQQLKRVADNQSAHSSTLPLCISEMGGFSGPSERIQQQEDALMLGRFKRMSNVGYVFHNGSTGQAATNDTSWWERELRPRPAARQAAMINNALRPLPWQPALEADTVADPNVLRGAAEQGLLAVTEDFVRCTAQIQPAKNYIYVHRLKLTKVTTVANMLLFVGTAGATLTASQNLAGIYDSQGQLVAQTANQATAWQSTGLKTMALTAQAGFTLTLEPGYYWLGYVMVGTTAPMIAATPAAWTLAHAGFGSPYVAMVPGARHRIGFESAGGARTSLIALTNLSLSDSGYTQVPWLGLT